MQSLRPDAVLSSNKVSMFSSYLKAGQSARKCSAVLKDFGQDLRKYGQEGRSVAVNARKRVQFAKGESSVATLEPDLKPELESRVEDWRKSRVDEARDQTGEESWGQVPAIQSKPRQRSNQQNQNQQRQYQNPQREYQNQPRQYQRQQTCVFQNRDGTIHSQARVPQDRALTPR